MELQVYDAEEALTYIHENNNLDKILIPIHQNMNNMNNAYTSFYFLQLETVTVKGM